MRASSVLLSAFVLPCVEHWEETSNKRYRVRVSHHPNKTGPIGPVFRRISCSATAPSNRTHTPKNCANKHNFIPLTPLHLAGHLDGA
jgi:hypothetical protein